MHNRTVVTLMAATAVVFAAALAREAQAAPWSGAAKLAAAATTGGVVEAVACNGRQGRCPPGSFWRAGACRPC